MAMFDLPLAQLRAYLPPLTRQPDFDAYWQRTLAESASTPIDACVSPYPYPIEGPQVSLISYAGWRGARISGWYVRPAGDGPFPVLVHYQGYSGPRVDIHGLLSWVAAGYATISVDTRGQVGETPDPAPYSSGHYRGFMTAGVLDPEEYFYHGAYVDCVRALDFVASRPELDAGRIAITGASQGGGLTLAVAALDRRPRAAMARVPFMCHYRRALEISSEYPYFEIGQYIQWHPAHEEQVYRTLSYCDNLNLAGWITCPTLVTVGLQDLVCPPSTVFATYNRIPGEKDILVYPYMGHADTAAQWEPMFAWARRHLA